MSSTSIQFVGLALRYDAHFARNAHENYPRNSDAQVTFAVIANSGRDTFGLPAPRWALQ